MKSKIPCEPGPAPLMKLAQATGLCGGMLVPSSLKPPDVRSFARLGSRPSFIMLSERRGSMPSTPMMMIFLPAARDTRRTLPSQTPAPAAPTAAVAATPLRKVRRLGLFCLEPAIGNLRDQGLRHTGCLRLSFANDKRLAVHV